MSQQETFTGETISDESIKKTHDFTTLATPPVCVADFCLIPIGTPTASVSNEVAQVQRLLKKCGLSYSMHSAGTTVEGSWDDVMKVIGQCHAMLHERGVLRIQSDIRVGTRTDKKQKFEDKVKKVESLLAKDEE
ncbi:hypothetical protein BLS_002903 [Venturia inaequalis]|uniref:Thiamine-binding protein domain-containing protein n=1 Tax=Venturia inaequalis TaxID=5025 RepID=A0A8H3UQB9_VENIN|nr:hypothetical protein BLS_002903 [Venturia inaequalis]KAE9986465.1 hypothetical protein EG328_005691 [Venturia inaequalis]KAE9994842.1 hypothetical protein EG327_000056 [Venturia inaequalis]RDI83824.1 hypothetical protein Vi05172_g6175 [Venturia inaequalis]